MVIKKAVYAFLFFFNLPMVTIFSLTVQVIDSSSLIVKTFMSYLCQD